jgi:hypothetical protein
MSIEDKAAIVFLHLRGFAHTPSRIGARGFRHA